MRGKQSPTERSTVYPHLNSLTGLLAALVRAATGDLSAHAAAVVEGL